MLKKIIIVVVALILIGVGTGIYMWYKPHKAIEDVSSIPVTATGITKDYAADETKANAKYLDKGLEVTGAVTDTGRNQEGAFVISLDSGDPIASVQCTMRDKNAKAAKGQQVVIKGFCKGDNLGVVLSGCVIK